MEVVKKQGESERGVRGVVDSQETDKSVWQNAQ